MSEIFAVCLQSTLVFGWSTLVLCIAIDSDSHCWDSC